MRHRLRLLVLVDDKVFLPQTRNEATVLVGDGGRHVDQLDAAFEPEATFLSRR